MNIGSLLYFVRSFLVACSLSIDLYDLKHNGHLEKKESRASFEKA